MSKGQPRIALQHVQKAISLNDTNARALYLASTIYLSFCASAAWPRPTAASIAPRTTPAAP